MVHIIESYLNNIKGHTTCHHVPYFDYGFVFVNTAVTTETVNKIFIPVHRSPTPLSFSIGIR